MNKNPNRMPNTSEIDELLMNHMENLSVSETEDYLQNISVNEPLLTAQEAKEIKDSLFHKLNLPCESNEKPLSAAIQPTVKKFRIKHPLLKLAACVLLILILFNHNNIVQAFVSFFGLIPNVGIVTEEDDIRYILKETSQASNSNGTLTIENATATNESLTIGFTYREAAASSEEELLSQKDSEWDELIKNNASPSKDFTLIMDSTYLSFSSGISSSGLREDHMEHNYSLTYQTDKDSILPDKKYTLYFQEKELTVDFELTLLDTVNSIEELGATKTQNNISLTAVTKLSDDILQVSVYPMNNSEYKLISFYRDYEFKYRNQTLRLLTDQGEKDFTLTGRSGLNDTPVYTFDLSDNSVPYELYIPYVVVQSNETTKVKLTIPEPGEIKEVNKELQLDHGSVVITSVERVKQSFDGDSLLIHFGYPEEADNSLVYFGLSGTEGSEAWSEFYDDQGRLSALEYALYDNIDKNNITFKVTNIYYLLDEEYHIPINVEQP